jgi:hypothetical protein
VIREDHELRASLARLNTAMAPFSMRIMEDTTSADEQRTRDPVSGPQHRADAMNHPIIGGDVVTDTSLHRIPPSGSAS